MNLDAHLAYQRAKTKTVSARARSALARLGGETASHSRRDLTEGLSAEEIERDAQSIRNILRVWKITGKGGRGSTIILPSGRELKSTRSGDDAPRGGEMAIKRLPRHIKKKRR